MATPTGTDAIARTVRDYFEAWFEGDVPGWTAPCTRSSSSGAGDMASVTVHTAVYHEYVHLVRTADGRRIANTLWQPA